MLNIDFTFLWAAINLVVLYLFLNHFLFKRVGGYMNARAKKIESDMQEADTRMAEGEQLKAEQQALMDATRDDRSYILVEAREKASAEADVIVTDAKRESNRMLADAREKIEREREKMMGELRGEVASLALKAASKVVEANMDSEKNRKLVDEFLDKEGVA